jgi:phosphatidylglycerophosphate synthase
MATLEPNAISSPTGSPEPIEARIAGPKGWKRRLEDPFNTYYRYPIALAITRLLVRTPVTPNQVSMVQPVFAAGAGYCLTFDDYRMHVAAVMLFELRSILDCVDGSLARAKKMSSPNGHAIDAMADWLGVVLLYCGIFHYVFYHQPEGYSRMAAMGIVALALFQGGIRSAASDYFKSKYLGIYERAKDEGPELLREKVLGLSKSSSIFAYIDVGIMRFGHLMFELERFNPEKTKPIESAAIERMVREQSSPKTKLIAFLWSVSSGDAFLSFVILSILVDKLWAGQVFFASVGCAWILFVCLFNVSFLRSYRAAPSP